MHRRGL